MKRGLIISILSIVLMMLYVGFIVVPDSPPANKYELKVIKIDGEWKVVDASDYSKTRVKVKQKDTIVWTVAGTNTYFQFPVKLFNPVGTADSLIGGYTKFVRDGKKLKLKVKDDAPAGTYEYAVFCAADGVFARGESPPNIVIE